MNLKRYRRLYRLVACITVLGLVLPLFPTAVFAQGQAPMQVGVVEFRNESGSQGAMLARAATDAVVIEMSKSNRFDVITRAQIDSQMKELGIRSPLSPIEISRLGEALAAEAMVEGAVKSVSVRGDQNTKTAYVTMVVRMIDQASGQVINGAVQTGVARAKVGDNIDDEKLISQALDNGAYLAVKTMTDYIIPEATVQNTIRTNEIMMNKGARDGLRPGMKMIVTRDREVIGEVVISEVDPLNSTARITKQTRGIQPEDKARAIFDMPTIEQASSKPNTSSSASTMPGAKKVKSSTSVKSILLTLAAIGLVSQMWRSHGESVGGVLAEPQVAPDGTGGVRISWSSGTLGKGLNVTEYSIWRDGEAEPIGTVDPAFGQLYYFDDTATTGVPHRYYVSATYTLTSTTTDSTGGGTGGESTEAQTEKKAAIGPATPLPRIPLASLTVPLADSQQNLHKVTFQWLSQLGGDTYVVEVSTDPIFSNPQFVSSLVTARPSPAGQTLSLTVNETLYTLFKTVPSTQSIYWRVGARAAGDNPGPVPQTGRSNSRFIYSEINAFRPIAGI